MKIEINDHNVSIVIGLEAETEEEKSSIKNLIHGCQRGGALGECGSDGSWVQIICKKDKAQSPDINQQLEDEGYHPR